MASFTPLLLAFLTGALSAQEPRISDLAFMSGCWEGSFGEGGSVIQESYTAATTQLMLGTTRYLQDDRTTFFEFTRIEMDSAGVHLVPYPAGEQSVPFRLVELERNRAVFANPDHDFPKRIIYARSENELVARIEGDGRAREWRMTRTDCGTTVSR